MPPPRGRWSVRLPGARSRPGRAPGGPPSRGPAGPRGGRPSRSSPESGPPCSMFSVTTRSGRRRRRGLGGGGSRHRDDEGHAGKEAPDGLPLGGHALLPDGPAAGPCAVSSTSAWHTATRAAKARRRRDARQRSRSPGARGTCGIIEVHDDVRRPGNSRHARPSAAEPPGLRDGPVQPALPVLHAGGGVRLAQPRRSAHLRGDSAGGRGVHRAGGGQGAAHRRGASPAPRRGGPGRHAGVGSGRSRPGDDDQRRPPRGAGAGPPGGRAPPRHGEPRHLATGPLPPADAPQTTTPRCCEASRGPGRPGSQASSSTR